MASSTLLATIALLLVALPSGLCIRCWVCSSDIDQRCGDPFNMTHHALTDCERDRSQSPYMRYAVPVCRKQKQRVHGEAVVVRSCNWGTEDDPDDGPCSTPTTQSYVKVDYCKTCNTDACNGAGPGGAPYHLILGLPAVLFVAAFCSPR